MDISAARPEPIPVYAEMSSVNPIFILPSALRERRAAIASGLHGSVTTGAGQFCTKPGLVFLPAGSDAAAFLADFEALIRETPAQSLLTGGIHANFERLTVDRPAASVHAATQPVCGFGVNASYFLTTSADFLTTPTLADEVFGPTTLFITYPAESDLPKLAATLEGQLTATIHGANTDLANHEELLQILETKAGRLIFNGFPTGVEVGAAIVHGGPYPATSDSRTSAVGTRAIERFCRYVCWQNFPDESLPAELRNENPRSIRRQVDGRFAE
jgi:NADP-dependent aldehyde dehydrogenase